MAESKPSGDTVERRLKTFVKFAVDFTMEEVNEIRQVSLDKDKAKGVDAKKVADLKDATSPLNTATYGVSTAVIKVGEMTIDQGLKKKEHDLAKKLHKVFFEGIEENDKDLRKKFIEAYSEFFINRNLQFFHILKDLEDSWENAMWVLAKDANHRLFNYLEVMVSNSQEQELDTHQKQDNRWIFECLEKGTSYSSIMNMVSKRKLNGQGGIIKTRTKEFLTRNLFDRPVIINNVKCDNDIDIALGFLLP